MQKGKISQHPSFGMLSFSRLQNSYGLPLFGSSIKHKNTIRLTLRTGEVERKINTDWYHSGRVLYEVDMSGEQFANLITNMNCGNGVPVTIRATEKGGRLDFFDVPFESKSDIHEREFKEHCDNTMSEARNLLEIIRQKFAEKKSFTKADKKEIEDLLWKLNLAIGSNLEYQLSSFNEQVEQTMVEAKAEIEMFWQNRIMQIANNAIKDNPNVLLDVSVDNKLIELQ